MRRLPGDMERKGLPATPGPIRRPRQQSRPRSQTPDKEKPRNRSCGVLGKDPGDDLLSHARCTLPSARARFTSEFGMESGGSTQLLSPGRGWRVAGRSDGVIPWE